MPFFDTIFINKHKAALVHWEIGQFSQWTQKQTPLVVCGRRVQLCFWGVENGCKKCLFIKVSRNCAWFRFGSFLGKFGLFRNTNAFENVTQRRKYTSPLRTARNDGPSNSVCLIDSEKQNTPPCTRVVESVSLFNRLVAALNGPASLLLNFTYKIKSPTNFATNYIIYIFQLHPPERVGLRAMWKCSCG